MGKSTKSIEICMPSWTKKHGYIRWHIKDDNVIRQFFGDEPTLELSIQGRQPKKRTVEYQYRRLGIGYAITQALPEETSKVVLTKTEGNIIKVDFK